VVVLETLNAFNLTGRAPEEIEEGEDLREWKGGILKCGVCGLVG
jgi:hypothetical protein